MSNNEIPSGSYACTLSPDEDGIVRFPIVPGRGDGALSIKIKLDLWAKGAEQPFAQVESEQCIDADAPARGTGTETTPYGFMVLTLKALGAESDAVIDDAVINGLGSEDQCMVFPGTPRHATAEVGYKAGSKGGAFMNVKVYPIREVTDDARAKAIAAAKARAAANKPAPSPFGPAPAGRGVGVRPPAPAR